MQIYDLLFTYNIINCLSITFIWEMMASLLSHPISCVYSLCVIYLLANKIRSAYALYENGALKFNEYLLELTLLLLATKLTIYHSVIYCATS